MIARFSKGYVLLDVNGKQVQIWGDRLKTSEKGIGFATSLKQSLTWMDGSIISNNELADIEQTLRADFLEHGWELILV